MIGRIMETSNLLLAASVIATGLMAGLFYGWVVSVIPGTTRIDDADYVNVMQHINREILTPRFLVPFIGIPLLLAATAVAQFRSGDQRRGTLTATAAGVYFFGVFGVTAAGNVPLNDSLDAFDLGSASPDEIGERRSSYEQPWNRWNGVRAVANVAAFGLLSVAAVLADEESS